MIHSNHPRVSTGYGVQTSLLASRLRDDGHQVAISAFFGQAGWVAEIDGIRVYPAGFHLFGNDVLEKHAANWFGSEPGLILTLVDVWVLDAASLSAANVACWTPVDHQPAPPKVIEFLEMSQAVPVAMSRFGETQLRNAGLDPLYVPHGIDTAAYQPIDQQQARKDLGLPESAFLVGMVAANKGIAPPRKGFAQALQAFQRFQARVPEAILYLHTEPLGRIEGVHLPQLLNSLGVNPDNVRFTDPYLYHCGLPSEWMQKLYSSFDALLNPALGEGFGIPIVEAQACGTPVIVGDWTSMPELCGAGWRVQGDPLWTPQGSWMFQPFVESIVAALDEAHAQAGTLRAQAREFALGYDADRVFAEYWRPALAEIERRCFSPAPVLPELVELPVAA